VYISIFICYLKKPSWISKTQLNVSKSSTTRRVETWRQSFPAPATSVVERVGRATNRAWLLLLGVAASLTISVGQGGVAHHPRVTDIWWRQTTASVVAVSGDGSTSNRAAALARPGLVALTADHLEYKNHKTQQVTIKRLVVELQMWLRATGTSG